MIMTATNLMITLNASRATHAAIVSFMHKHELRTIGQALDLMVEMCKKQEKTEAAN